MLVDILLWIFVTILVYFISVKLHKRFSYTWCGPLFTTSVFIILILKQIQMKR